jgi:hypothetical protein
MDGISPDLPVDLCGMTPCDFSRALQIRWRVSWQRFQRMISKILMPETGLKVTLDAIHSQGTLQAFKDSWSPLGKEYNASKEFCGGIARVRPGTSLVESNFSSIGHGIHIQSH